MVQFASVGWQSLGLVYARRMSFARMRSAYSKVCWRWDYGLWMFLVISTGTLNSNSSQAQRRLLLHYSRQQCPS